MLDLLLTADNGARLLRAPGKPVGWERSQFLVMIETARTDPPGWPGRLAEVVVIGMACAAPWLFGSVDAWAQLALELGAGLVAVLAALWGGGSIRWKNLVSVPSLALGGLVALALVQASPLPGRLLGVLDPSAASLRADLVPGAPERVIGDDGPP